MPQSSRPLVSLVAGLVVAHLAMGCSSTESSGTGTPTSTLRGALVTASFPSAPTAIEATSEAGEVVRSTVAQDGTFQLSLNKAHTYRVQVMLAAGSEPLVFPRASSRLDRSFRVSSGAASVDLGAVRHLDAAPPQGFSLSTSAEGECEDGKDAVSGATCVDDDSQVSCEGGKSEGADDKADGECENGKDAVTGAACTDPEEENDDQDADPSQPMALPEHNAPDDIGGCEDGADDGEASDD